MQVKTRFKLVILATALLAAIGANAREIGYHLTEIFVPQTSQFAQNQAPAAISSFDLSPDGKTVAIEFGTQEPDEKFGDWVALWDVGTQRLLGARQVEWDVPTVVSQPVRSHPPVRFPDPWYTDGVRFSPGGHMLLALTGPRLVALSVPDLKTLYAITDPVPVGNSAKRPQAEDPTDPRQLEAALRADSRTKGKYIEGFAMARDRLAVLEQTSHEAVALLGLQPTLKVLIADLQSGKILSRWERPGLSHSIAISPDGKLVALTISPYPWGYGDVRAGENDIFVLNADSGQVVTAFSSGFVPGDAQFLPGGEQLITAPNGFARARQDAVEVWNLKTGNLERKLGYPKVGVGGDMAVSANGEWAAVVNIWMNPTDVKFDRDNPRGLARLLLWNLRSGDLVYDSGNLGPEYDLTGMPIGMIVGTWSPQILVRMSASGDRLAVGGKVISVRSIERGVQQVAQRR